MSQTPAKEQPAREPTSWLDVAVNIGVPSAFIVLCLVAAETGASSPLDLLNPLFGLLFGLAMLGAAVSAVLLVLSLILG